MGERAAFAAAVIERAEAFDHLVQRAARLRQMPATALQQRQLHARVGFRARIAARQRIAAAHLLQRREGFVVARLERQRGQRLA